MVAKDCVKSKCSIVMVEIKSEQLFLFVLFNDLTWKGANLHMANFI